MIKIQKNIMRNPVISAVGTLVAVLAISPASAQPLGSADPDHFGFSYRMGFNITASFKNLGGFASLTPLTNPGRTPNNDPFNYDNGYIFQDATSANHPGYTWYYGYLAGTPQRPAEAPTDFDLYRSSSTAQVSSNDRNGDPQHSFELTYNRQIGRFWRGFWGVEAGLGYTDITIRDNRTFRATVTRVTDTYRTGGGAILQPPPFAGTFEGPLPNDPNGWPLVGTTPVATATDAFAGAATISGNRQFDAQVVSLRLGPYLEIPLNERWSISLSAGLALLEAFSDFKFNETVSIDPNVSLAPLPNQNHRGSGSNNDWLAGGFAAATISYSLNEHFKLFSATQFQDVGKYTHVESGKKAVLDLSQSIFVTVGFGYSF
jgi:hypothetical protein